jgi:hypothetical protein
MFDFALEEEREGMLAGYGLKTDGADRVDGAVGVPAMDEGGVHSELYCSIWKWGV